MVVPAWILAPLLAKMAILTDEDDALEWEIRTSVLRRRIDTSSSSSSSGNQTVGMATT